MPSDPPTLASLCTTFPRIGVVTWLAIRTRRRAPVTVVDRIAADPALGLVGDHFSGRRLTARQVTLLQAEHLPVIASFLGMPAIDPAWLRRNIVIEGVNLLALTGHFRVGPVLLEATGHCHPCSRMEENLGSGGYNAMRGHGGITARVLCGGILRLGDAVTPAPDPAAGPPGTGDKRGRLA